MVHSIAAAAVRANRQSLGGILRSPFLLLVSCVLAATSLRAAEVTSPRGFSFKHPDDWKVLTASQQETVSHELKSLLERLGKINLHSMAVMVVNPVEDAFAENINVVVAPGVPKADAAADREYAQALSQMYSTAGVHVVGSKVERTKFGGREVLSAHSDVRFPGHDDVVRQWQVVFPGRSQSYVVTCSAQVSDFHRYEPIFAEAIESMRVDVGLGGLWYSLPTGMRWAIVGGLVGLGFSVLSSFGRKPAG